MYAFLCGAGCPWRAIRLLVRQPALWRYVAIPVGLNLLVGVVLYTTLLLAGFHLIGVLVEGWPAWIAWLLRGLLVITLFVTLGYVLVRFGVVLGAPFYRKNAVKPCTLGQGYKAHAVLSSQTCDKIAV